MALKILHISNAYSGSEIYRNLIKNIDDLNIKQIVYSPVRRHRLIGKNNYNFNNNESGIIYSKVLNFFTRINYFGKIKKIKKDIESKVDFREIGLIHAHTWFSDGGVAYKLSKKYGVPYVISVRNTDLNIFYRFLLYVRPFGRKVILKSKAIVFISPIYFKRFFSAIFSSSNCSIKSKSYILPNGIDGFWIRNSCKRKHLTNNVFQVLYIGVFKKGKNIERLIKAIVELNKSKMLECHLNIVGKGGGRHKQIIKLIKKYENYCSYYGYISEKEKLKELIRNNDVFAMPSIRETFGLVYIEALSQGIPVVYTKGEGIDGYFDGSIGEAVNSSSIESIANGIKEIADNYGNYQFDSAEIVKKHDWKLIASKYVEIYTNVINLPEI